MDMLDNIQKPWLVNVFNTVHLPGLFTASILPLLPYQGSRQLAAFCNRTSVGLPAVGIAFCLLPEVCSLRRAFHL
jgi:hypothetical protein